MSAVYGIFDRKKNVVDVKQFERMQRVLSFRAVDAQSTKLQSDVALGHMMMRTTPQASYENLPYTHVESGISITCDARLDNRKYLISSLIPQLQPGFLDEQSIPDSFLVLKAYEKWGDSFPGHLLGDFAIVIWNPRTQSMYCVRDHMGVKPFYYMATRRLFVFASDLRGIHAAMAGLLTVNDKRIADYLLGYEYYDFESTYFQDVYRLPPAHLLTVTPGQVNKTCYWQPNFQEVHGPKGKIDQEYLEEFNEILTTAVSDRMVSANPVGCLLSGGIDSAAVFTEAKMLGAVTSFSGVSLDSSCRDTQEIRAILRGKHRQADEITVEQLVEVEADLAGCIDNLDDPFSSYMVMLMALYLKAKRGNHRVMLDGVDGDLVMSLTGDYTTGIMRQGDWAGALRELRGAVSNGRSDSVLAGLFRGFRSILIPSWLKRGKYELLGRQEVLSELNDSLLSNSLRQDATIVERYVSHQRLQVERFKTAKEQHRWFISQPYLAVALERYDRIASVCGVEARHPLLDKRLVEFSLNLPWHLKVNRGWGKWMLRWSMQSRLPESTLWRMDKPHLGASFTDAWMKAHWSSFSSLVKSNRELWKPYLSESSVLPYFMTPDYNPEEPVSDPWDIVHLIKWLKLYT